MVRDAITYPAQDSQPATYGSWWEDPPTTAEHHVWACALTLCHPCTMLTADGRQEGDYMYIWVSLVC